MALSLQEFLKQAPPLQNFCKCGQPLLGDADPSPGKGVEGKEICGDCASDQISEMIDLHPVGRPAAK